MTTSNLSSIAPPAGPASSVTAPIAAIERIKRRIPDHARDLRINLGVITAATALSPPEAWGTSVAAAVASPSPELVAAIEEAAAPHLTPEALAAARAAASIMGMNN